MGIVTLTDIQNFATDLAREFLPEKVILFGSYANGNAKAESDVDLLVVMPEEVSGPRVAVDIIRRLKPALPVELVVRSSRQIEQRLALNDFFSKRNTGYGEGIVCSPSPLSGIPLPWRISR